MIRKKKKGRVQPEGALSLWFSVLRKVPDGRTCRPFSIPDISTDAIVLDVIKAVGRVLSAYAETEDAEIYGAEYFTFVDNEGHRRKRRFKLLEGSLEDRKSVV